MRDIEWRLLTTLPDLPSAQSLAEVLTAKGMPARVSSDAGVLGQAAPSRVYVSAPLFYRAREYLAQGIDLAEDVGQSSGPDDAQLAGR
jgi:hypothetical protein